MKRNSHIAQLKTQYLFPEINARKQKYLAEHPEISLISLGVGDTTEPIPKHIADRMSQMAAGLATRQGYSGYGPEKGIKELREKLASVLYHNNIHPDEIFVADGAKCDLGRLQTFFGGNVSIAVQNPSYPVYIDGSLLQGIKEIVPMPCTPENHFFPDLSQLPRTDLIYFCSPNNPTGAVSTREQLQELVTFAQKNRSIIIYDSAYANYIQDPTLPKSIYEIPGAKEVAIEVSSFSKLAGFTGVRLGWTVVPDELRFDDGSSVKADWYRFASTVFNGASNIAQHGGIAALEVEGLQEMASLTNHYLENVKILREALSRLDCEIFGGNNAPYLWVRFKDLGSWDLFQLFLEKFHIVTTPGMGFGTLGEGFLRFTAFGSRAHMIEAAKRLEKLQLKK